MTEAKFSYYNSEKDITLKEYGRNIQNVVDKIIATDDRAARTRLAHTAIELMRQLNPNVNEGGQDYTHKLWDDLFIISDFKLDVDSPFPMPEPDVLYKRPERMTYPSGHIRYKHYGRSILSMIEKAKNLPTSEEREAAAISIGKLMKMFYKIWNKDNVEDIVIIDQLAEISRGELTLSLEQVQKGRLLETEKPKFTTNSYASRPVQQVGNGVASGQRKYGTNLAAPRKGSYFDHKKKK